MMEFPTLVYRTPGQHFGPGGTTYDYAAVADEDAMAAFLKIGWHASLAEAVARVAVTRTSHDEEDDESSITREELESMGKDLGVKFDGRTTDAALLRRVEAATKGGE